MAAVGRVDNVVVLSGELFDAIEVNAARTGNHKRAAVRMSRLAVQATAGGMSRAEAHMRAGEQWLLADEPTDAVEQFQKAITDGGSTFACPRTTTTSCWTRRRPAPPRVTNTPRTGPA